MDQRHPFSTLDLICTRLHPHCLVGLALERRRMLRNTVNRRLGLLALLTLCIDHQAWTFGFSVAGRWALTRLPPRGTRAVDKILRAGNDDNKEEPTNGEMPKELTVAVDELLAANDCKPGEACDLGEAFERELEEGYRRRYPEIIQRQNSFIDDVIEAVLDTVFVRRQNSTSLKKMFLTKRSYGRNATFSKESLTKPPVVEDLLPYPTPIADSFYLSVPAAILTFLVSSAIFPFLADFMVDFVDIPPANLEQINSKLVPGISILYGTFISLTLSILYNRQRQVQDSVAQETSLLGFLLHNMVSLFRRDRKRMVRAGQSAADQVRILLRENRGIEFMNLIYTDPYIRLLELIEEEEERLVEEHGDFFTKGVSV